MDYCWSGPLADLDEALLPFKNGTTHALNKWASTQKMNSQMYYQNLILSNKRTEARTFKTATLFAQQDTPIHSKPVFSLLSLFTYNIHLSYCFPLRFTSFLFCTIYLLVVVWWWTSTYILNKQGIFFTKWMPGWSLKPFQILKPPTGMTSVDWLWVTTSFNCSRILRKNVQLIFFLENCDDDFFINS